MAEPRTSLAATVFGASILEVLFTALRVLAVLGGFVVGWLIGGAVVRVVARLAFNRVPPGWVVMTGRFLVGIVLGLVVYLYFGLGPGPGGRPGSGKDGGEVKDKGRPPAGDKDQPGREPLVIHVLGGPDV